MKVYRTPGPHYGKKDWDEGYWIDPFICTGCGVDHSVLHNSSEPHKKLYGRRYGSVVIACYICGCGRDRFNLLLLDENDCIASHHTISESELLEHWPQIAPYYIEDEWDDDSDDEWDAVTEEREYWPVWSREYHLRLEGRESAR